MHTGENENHNIQTRYEWLNKYGWNTRVESSFAEQSQDEIFPARITADHGQKYKIVSERGEGWAELSGRQKYELEERSAFPAVGDWVLLRYLTGTTPDGIIHGLLPRSSRISRRSAGTVPVEQLIAVNVDLLLLVAALNHDLNLRRLERYLVMAWNSGANPVILLSKADLAEEPDAIIAEVEAIAPGVPVIAVSAKENQGREQLEALLKPGLTIAMTGSSGAGKSTILNWLCGEELQATTEVREDDSRGRHTTTHRELFPLPQGAVMIDTPGMRELQLWEDQDGGWAEAFADIERLAADCRFKDCRHEQEAGCAVLAAISKGELERKRLDNYRRTERELKYQHAKENQRKRSQHRTGGKKELRRDKGAQRRRYELEPMD
ncbi:ribosome small subunit-dependent GTPase A [Paenibacillus brevis]|uniref:Small ribosomal subunit biogenesis GTPase RsgA n=1 Tax=Paenibacillus brevis TaxID=2841508 RepID=A0ABS6FTQ2_9BACL|nr:ribosome small subunit-dependent GTPase A [Paenibacillus brevis]MBU5673469.1 ribosome small subunit-dependent GTPase A [Paenibacillus brevis]